MALIISCGPVGGAVDAARRGLSRHHSVRVVDLDAVEFGDHMTEAEWKAYHTTQPIVDPVVAEHAALARQAAVLAFVYPSVMWGPHPRLKAWLERVLVPGVAFVLDEGHHVRPNMSALRAIAGFTAHDRPTRQVGDGGRRILLRALRLNAPRRLRTAWVAATDIEEPGFLDEVERRAGRL